MMNGVMAHVMTAMMLCTLSIKIMPGRKIMTNSLEMLPRAHRLRCDRKTFQFCGTIVNALARNAWAVCLAGKRLKMMAVLGIIAHDVLRHDIVRLGAVSEPLAQNGITKG